MILADPLSEAESFPPVSICHSIFFFSACLLSTYCVPDMTMPGSRDTAVSKNVHGPCHCGGCKVLGETGESIPANKWKKLPLNMVRKEMYRCYESICKYLMVRSWMVSLGKSRPVLGSKEVLWECGLKWALSWDEHGPSTDQSVPQVPSTIPKKAYHLEPSLKYVYIIYNFSMWVSGRDYIIQE